MPKIMGARAGRVTVGQAVVVGSATGLSGRAAATSATSLSSATQQVRSGLVADVPSRLVPLPPRGVDPRGSRFASFGRIGTVVRV